MRYTVLVDRVLKYYDPFNALGIERDKVEALIKTTPIIETWKLDKSEWSQEQHAGRIRFLIENPSNDPIEIDNDCSSGWFGTPIVCDGHHRLIAAIFSKTSKILTTYGGLVSALEWLQGLRDDDPYEPGGDRS